jgi:Cysteine rich repeat
MLKTVFAMGAVVLLSTNVAMAQQQAVIAECAADIRAACGDVPPGAGAIRSCLNSHLADLTQPCRTVLVGAAAVANECRGDIRAMCADVQPGGGRIEACLQANLTSLSPPCVDVMARTVGRGE